MYIPSSGNVELTDILTGLSEMQSKEKIGKLLFHFNIYFSFSTQNRHC